MYIIIILRLYLYWVIQEKWIEFLLQNDLFYIIDYDLYVSNTSIF